MGQALPSVVLAAAAIKWLIEHGNKRFDFGAGQYAYKQRFGCDLVPLHVLQQTCSLRGRAVASAIAATDRLRASPFGSSLGLQFFLVAALGDDGGG